MEPHTHDDNHLTMGCPACLLEKNYGVHIPYSTLNPVLTTSRPPNRERVKTTMTMIHALFFANTRGPWYTVRPITHSKNT